MESIPFLFDPTVWGTVSDWSMVAVTTITAFYLYKTLRSQKEVQDIQAKLLEIESIRFRESIKPILKVILKSNKKGFTPGSAVITFEVSNTTDKMAIDVTLVYKENNEVSLIGQQTKQINLTKDDGPLLMSFGVKSTFITPIFIIFDLTYRDVAGTKYKQNVWYAWTSFDLEQPLVFTLPAAII